MKVAMFMPSLGGGGAERVMILLAKNFISRGIAVDLVVTSSRGELKALVPEGITIIDLGVKRIAFSVLPFAKYLRTTQPSVVISALTPTNCIASLASLIVRSKTRLYLVEHTDISRYESEAHGFRTSVMLSLMKFLYRKQTGVIAVSNGVARSLSGSVGLDIEAIHVIYNPVITDAVYSKYCDTKPRARPASAVLKLITAGRLVKAKDHNTMIDAFNLLLNDIPAHLTILGEGECKNEIERRLESFGIEDSVRLLGFVEDPFPYYHESDLFVLSSTREGLPTVLIEALAVGLPIVSTDCPSGPREVLESGRYGSLVPVGDSHKLYMAIKSCLLGNQKFERADIDQYRVDFACNRYADLVLNHNSKTY